MMRFLPACIALFAFSSVSGLGDDTIPAGHSTVHIVFIAPHSHQTGDVGMGEMAGTQSPMVRVGDIMEPADGMRPIKISIDGDFVGHALVGMWDINPLFVLPEGKHKLTFAIEGLKPIAADCERYSTD